MTYRLRLETTALEDLQIEEKEASEAGPVAFSSFKETSKEEALKEGPDLGASLVSGGSTSSSSDTSDTSSDGDSSDDDSEGESEDGSDEDDDSEDDFSMDDDPTETEEEPEEEEDVDDSEDEAEVKKESFRTLSFLPGEEPNIRMESLFPEGIASGFISSTWSGLSYVVSGLATIGLKFTPILLGGMFKIVLFTFAKTFNLLDNLFSEAGVRFKRYIHNTERQKVTIKALKTRVEELKLKNVKLPIGSVPDVNIDALLITGSNDLSANIKDFSIFLETKIATFQKSILGGFNSLKAISTARYLQKSFDPLDSMVVSPAAVGFTTHYSSKDDLENFVGFFGMGEMIGQVEVQALLPEVRFDTWDNVEKAYGASKIFISTLPSHSAQETPIMEIGALGEFINQLELLAEASLKHQSFYEEISQSRSGVINSIKQLFIRLCEEKVKVSFKNSVVLPLHLKSSFVTKVYMTGAMDLHDHTARVIANGLSYADAMLKLYRDDANQ